MSDRETVLASICRRLNEEAARYLLIGARALQLWGSTSATLHLAILIEPTPANAERVLRAMRNAGFGFAKEWLAADVAARQVTVLGTVPRVDIMTVACGVQYRHAALSAQPFMVEGVTIPTASLNDLIATMHTGRPEDAAAVRVLEEIRRLPAGQA
ncbi:MAG: hypothetical protein SGI84_06590 [Gemmatimonadota bacterium]|nr:hypothetical protein [Gemmatimonadota bacterium]